MAFFEIDRLVLLVLGTPVVCTLMALFAGRWRMLASSLIFIVSIFGGLLSLNLISGFLEHNHHFLNVTFLNVIVLNIEPINLIFATMVLWLWCATNLYSISYLSVNSEIRPIKFYFFLSLSIFFTLCIAFSSNLISMFVAYELLTLSTYPLVSHLGKEKERQSARIYLYILLSASLLLFLPAVAFLTAKIGNADFMIGGIISGFSAKETTILFLLLLYGVAKSAIVPVHFWLPKAMVASFPVSAVLHAVAVVKSGIFIMLKISVYIFGLEYLQHKILAVFNINIISILCALSLLISSILALYQTRIKMLLAYSTANQLSICLLAMSMFHSLAIKASILHMVSHAFGKITLFFASGYVYCNSAISDIKDLKGLGKEMKLIMAIFTIAAFSIIGIPIFAGFVSKSYIYYSALTPSINYFVLVVLTGSILFTAHYFIKIIYKIYEEKSEVSGKDKSYEHKLFSSMTFATVFTSAGVIFYLFLYPYIGRLIDVIRYAA